MALMGAAARKTCRSYLDDEGALDSLSDDYASEEEYTSGEGEVWYEGGGAREREGEQECWHEDAYDNEAQRPGESKQPLTSVSASGSAVLVLCDVCGGEYKECSATEHEHTKRHRNATYELLLRARREKCTQELKTIAPEALQVTSDKACCVCGCEDDWACACEESTALEEGPFDVLPDETLALLFSKLNIRDILVSSCVCRRWQRILADEEAWKIRFAERFSNLSENIVPALAEFLPESPATLGVWKTRYISAHRFCLTSDKDTQRLFEYSGHTALPTSSHGLTSIPSRFSHARPLKPEKLSLDSHGLVQVKTCKPWAHSLDRCDYNAFRRFFRLASATYDARYYVSTRPIKGRENFCVVYVRSLKTNALIKDITFPCTRSRIAVDIHNHWLAFGYVDEAQGRNTFGVLNVHSKKYAWRCYRDATPLDTPVVVFDAAASPYGGTHIPHLVATDVNTTSLIDEHGSTIFSVRGHRRHEDNDGIGLVPAISLACGLFLLASGGQFYFYDRTQRTLCVSGGLGVDEAMIRAAAAGSDSALNQCIVLATNTYMLHIVYLSSLVAGESAGAEPCSDSACGGGPLPPGVDCSEHVLRVVERDALVQVVPACEGTRATEPRSMLVACSKGRLVYFDGNRLLVRHLESNTLLSEIGVPHGYCCTFRDMEVTDRLLLLCSDLKDASLTLVLQFW